MSTSPSPAPDAHELHEAASTAGMVFPVETEIYILPDGRVVIADLPAELARPLSQLGPVLPCEISNHDILDSTS
ncbi:MAG: hypothetical protein M9936_07200 [Caldilinea sp.]|nr:hypothetical protein [Caldilinea sp.]MCB0137749.1 hypothetical protein [Caldilineaceae bacterium]MCB0039804.1 hypothetical protein [Caldilinea sp.]MCB0050334.1 hypothetical protein [Caldilinea sp.]MCB0148488.1 hypothetical protein [Caldilineaceae bacterium]